MKHLLFILFIFITLLGISQDKLPAHIKENYRIARDAQVKGEFQKAVHYSYKALKSSLATKNEAFIFKAQCDFGVILTDAGIYDKAIKHLWEAEALIKNKPEREKSFNSGMGRLFERMEIYETAIEFYEKYSINKKYKGSGTLANLYAKIGQHDISIKYYREKVNESHNSSLRNKISVHNNLGVGFSRVPQEDSALIYYQKALNYSAQLTDKTPDDDFLFGTIHGNIGSIHYDRKNYSEAAEHLSIDFKYSKEFEKFDIAANVGCMLFYSCLELGQLERCKEIVLAMHPLKNKITKHSYLKLLAVEVIHYKSSMNLIYYRNLLKKYEAASDSYISLIEEKGSTIARVLVNYRTKKLSTEHKYQKAETDARLKFTKQKEKNSRLLVILIASIASMSLMVVTVFYRNRRKQAGIKALLLESEKSKLDSELKLKKLELTDFAINLTRNKEFGEELSSKIGEIKKAPSNEVSKGINDLSILVNQHLNTGATLQLFQENVDQVNKEFFESLTRVHPDLTHNEKEICGLVRLQLSNKEIASIKNISIQSARTARYRLKKKLKLDSETEVVDYLLTL